MNSCPGCTHRRGDDGVWRSIGPHRAGCGALNADIADRREVLDEIEARIAAHRAAAEEGCSDTCGHPLDSESAWAWREYHEISLRDEEQLAYQTRIELWALVSGGAGRLEVPMADAENILRLPAEEEENDYLARARADTSSGAPATATAVC